MDRSKEYVAEEIGVNDGYLVAFSNGLHAYQHCWDLAGIMPRIIPTGVNQ
ncbi:hypothetical protein ACFLTZ_03650 [Chloroflexota bacterium]